MSSRPTAYVALVTAAMTLPSCQLGYIIEQGTRQLSFQSRRVPLSSSELETAVEPEQREKLAWVPALLRFAERELGLDPGDAYRTYLDTGGAPISHTVVASHPLALVPYRWCFPFVGCVPYKGYFDREDAEEEAASLRERGLDVIVTPVGGYSTLGWFADPILSTMLDRSLPALIEVLIHETIHRTLYVPGETTFNESLATHVAREGTLLFLERYPQAAPSEEVERYLGGIEREARDEELLRRLRWDLESLYRSGLPSGEKLRRKAELFATARAARRALHGIDVDLPASNAYMILARDYHGLVPALAAIQEEQGGQPRHLMAYLQSFLKESGRLPEELTES